MGGRRVSVIHRRCPQGTRFAFAADPAGIDRGGMKSDWEARSAELEDGLPRVGAYPASGLIRRARRMRDLSQRELASLSGVPQSTVGRVESGTLTPSLKVLQRLLSACDLHLVVVDRDGRVVQPMRDLEDIRDFGGRRYPAHLNTILDPRPGEWWADQYGLARPPETFHRDQARRRIRQARSRWEVRVKQLRNAPEPPSVEDLALREKAQQEWAERLARPMGADATPTDTAAIDVDEWDGVECDERCYQGDATHGPPPEPDPAARRRWRRYDDDADSQ